MRKFSLYAEFFHIGNQDCILGLSCLTKNPLLVDTQVRCLRDTISGFVIPDSVGWIPSVTLLDLDLDPLEDGEIMLIIDASEQYTRYATCCSSTQAARLPDHKRWDHELPLQDRQRIIRTGAVYKTTCEEDEALQKYLY